MKLARMAEELGTAVADPPGAGRLVATLEVRFRWEEPFADRVVRFPCDRHGRVDIDALDDACRRDYLFARVLERLGHARSRIVEAPIPA